MSGLVLSAGVLWMMAPPISDFFSIDGSVNNGSANNHTGDDDIPKLISNYWNLTNDESDIDEVDLLKILDPLVASTPNHSDRERLSHVFQSINKVRLGTGADTNKSDPESDDKVLRRLLNDGALNSYIRKLISINGAYDRFGQVANNIELVALKQLLPVLIIEKTAFNYRRLVRQLVSIDSIGPKGERLLDEEDPFFDFDDQYPNHYNRMVKFVPKSLSGASIDCTFFTEDDCIAAREITTYFRSIDYLDEQGLGFSSSDPRRKRLATNSTRLIARLLNDWKAFTNEKPDDPQPNQVTNGKLPVNEIP